jgi:N-methylhydantoinase A
MVPRLSAGLSAFGGLVSDLRWQAATSAYSDSEGFAFDRVNAALAALVARCRDFLERAAVADADRAIEASFMGRYQFQSWEIEVPFELPADGVLTEADLPRLVAAFHATHRRIYGIADEGNMVEFVAWKATAVGRTRPRAAAPAPGEDGPLVEPAPKSSRPVFLPSAGRLETVPVYAGASFGAGGGACGPAIIEEETTTLFLLPGMTARVDGDGNYWVTCS